MTAPAYKRILLKLSGEALMGDDSYGINRAVVERIVAEIKEVSGLGVEVAMVIGGGNIFRGMAPAAAGMDRATADYMGMLATVMNSMALQDAMTRAGLECRVQSALNLEQVAEPFIRNKALRYLEDGKQTIEQLLKSKGASVSAFQMFIVGEGIEKKVEDYAAEVAAAAAAAKK